jgi:hypothetical protein
VLTLKDSQEVEIAAKTAEGQLKLAKQIAEDAKPELSQIAGFVEPETIENLTELIKLLTEQ